jgi:hypothetical protein
MTDTELRNYLKRLPDFCRYFRENKQSQLAKIFGVFTVSSQNFNKVNVVLMENTIQLQTVSPQKSVFDLKGSHYHRLEPENAAVLKCRNFSSMKANDSKICDLKQSDKSLLTKTLRKDVAFLKSQRLMDYSLLFCAERGTK